MPTMPPTHRRVASTYERDRKGARKRGYDTRWEWAAAAHLEQNKWCAYCALDGVQTLATVVDHLYPHRGDQAVFWFRRWWVSCCSSCHSSFKQSLERRGRAAIDAIADETGKPAIIQRGNVE